MDSFKKILEKYQRGPSDLLSLDIGINEVRAVRMKKVSDEEVAVTNVDILPSIENLFDETIPEVPAMALPQKLRAKYVSLAVSGENAVIKLLSFPKALAADADKKIVEGMGIENMDDYRLSYKVVTEGHGRAESRVLVVAMPINIANSAGMLFPVGRPAPFSMEISSLAAMTSFLNNPGVQAEENAVGVIEFGDNSSCFALFNKGTMALVRHFDIGTNSILENVQATLGVDRETAHGIITDGAFDISQSVSEVMDPLIKQLIVSRDFVERREDCHVGSIYVSGGLAASHDSLEEMKNSMGVEIKTWNPFDGLTVAPGALPEDIAGNEWQFAAAVGTGLATFEES